MTDRDLFERWFVPTSEWQQALERDPRGYYKFSTTASAWTVWQGAAETYHAMQDAAKWREHLAVRTLLRDAAKLFATLGAASPDSDYARYDEMTRDIHRLETALYAATKADATPADGVKTP